MKTRINPFLISMFVFLHTALVFSQNHDAVVTPQKYNFSFSVMGGKSVFTNSFFPSEHPNGKTEPNVNVSATYYLSNSKAFKVDAGYTYTEPYYGPNIAGASVDVGGSKMFSTKLSLLVGRFKTNEHFMFDLSMGLGIHYWKQGSYTYNTIYFNPADSSTYPRSVTDEFETDLNVVVSLGGAVGYRFVKGFGICAEAEYDMITGYHHNYFPVRAGLFYIF